MEKFGQMLTKVRGVTPEKGDLEGECCICGEHTQDGFKKKFKSSFTSGNRVTTGDVICPECHYLVKESNNLRRTMFLLTEDEFKKFKKKEAKEVLMNLPHKPFYLYLTQTWQKIGWIMMDQAYNTGKGPEVNVVMDYDIIHVNINTLKKMGEFVQKFRKQKINKTEIETGQLSMHNYQKLMDKYGIAQTRKMVDELNRLVGNPEFQLATYIEE